MIRTMFVALVLVPSLGIAAELQVGSKRFTESYILGEIVKQTAQAGTHFRANASAHAKSPLARG